jgi:hypothetical protein
MDTIDVRLIWLDDRTPSMVQDIDHETTEINLTLPDGNHCFRTTEEVSMDGSILFREIKS